MHIQPLICKTSSRFRVRYSTCFLSYDPIIIKITINKHAYIPKEKTSNGAIIYRNHDHDGTMKKLKILENQKSI